jgi:uncharacterized membrane protein YfcA
MELLGYIAAVLIGLSLGLIGGGGSILTVPVLVYLFKVDPVLATTWSLFIVGVTSLTGGIRSYVKKKVDFKSVSEFGFPSILSIFVTRHFLLPAIPSTVFHSGNFVITKGDLLMIIFAVLMLVAAVVMIRNESDKDQTADTPHHANQHEVLYLILLGLGVGLITGLLGAGGGFLIIPALVLIVGLPMKIAIGTSLIIIAINSLFGFLFSLKNYEMNWQIILPFTIIAIGGIFLGSLLSDKLPGDKLKKGFGWFVLIMGAFIIFKELFQK